MNLPHFFLTKVLYLFSVIDDTIFWAVLLTQNNLPLSKNDLECFLSNEPNLTQFAQKLLTLHQVQKNQTWIKNKTTLKKRHYLMHQFVLYFSSSETEYRMESSNNSFNYLYATENQLSLIDSAIIRHTDCLDDRKLKISQ